MSAPVQQHQWVAFGSHEWDGVQVPASLWRVCLVGRNEFIGICFHTKGVSQQVAETKFGCFDRRKNQAIVEPIKKFLPESVSSHMVGKFSLERVETLLEQELAFIGDKTLCNREVFAEKIAAMPGQESLGADAPDADEQALADAFDMSGATLTFKPRLSEVPLA